MRANTSPVHRARTVEQARTLTRPTTYAPNNALCDTLELIIDHPDSAPARRDALRTATGTAVWRVTVRVPRETDDWAVLWHHDEAGRILIAFIGRL